MFESILCQVTELRNTTPRFLSLSSSCEGREGRRIGTLFTLGDEETVLARSRPLILDPLAGHPQSARHVSDPNLRGTYDRDGLQIVGISLDDDPKLVRAFYQQLRMNYPVAIGDAKLAEQYGGVLGLPVSFLIGRDARIYAKHVGETDVSLIEREIKSLL